MGQERSSKKTSELRKRAEKILAKDPQAIRTMVPADIQKLLHELNLHQIELEMQNEDFRRFQLELQEARDKYLNLYDFAPTGYFTIDRNSLIVDVNLAGSELLGSKNHTLIGTQFTSSISPDSQDAFHFHCREVLKTGIKGNCEIKILKADGTPFHAQLISMAVPEKDGNINHFRTAVIDITGRKRAEERIKLHERHLQSFLDLHIMAAGTEESILYFTLEASMRSLQSQFAFIGTMSADEAVMTIRAWSKGAMEQCAISDKPMHFPIAEAGLWAEVVRQRRPVIVNDYDASNGPAMVGDYDISTKYRKGYPKGHVPIKRFLGIPIFSASKIVAVAAVANKASEYDETDIRALTSLLNEMWNIIQHKQAEASLRESEEKFRSLAEQSPNMIFINVRGRLVYVNDRCEEIMGYKKEEFYSPDFDFLTLVAPEFKEPLRSTFSRHMEGKEMPSVEHTLVTKGGKRIEVMFTTKLIGYSGERAVLAVATDITKLKQAEEKLKETLAEQGGQNGARKK